MRLLLGCAAAFAAGYVLWEGSDHTRAAANRAGAPAPAPPRGAPAALAAEIEALREEVERAESVPRRERIVHGVAPLARKLRLIAELENDRYATLYELGRRMVYSRAAADEALELVRTETDEEILRLLGAMILQGCTTKMTRDPTWSAERKRSLFDVVRAGQPAARRAAAACVVGGDRSAGIEPEMAEPLRDVLRADPAPEVVRAAAEIFLRLHAPDVAPLLLEAFHRLPPGEDRRRVACAYLKCARSWELTKARFARARGPERDDWAAALSAYLGFVTPTDPALWRDDFVAIYAATTDRAIRRDLFRALTARLPPALEAMRAIRDAERDPNLRTRYDRILTAATSNDPTWTTKIDIHEILRDE